MINIFPIFFVLMFLMPIVNSMPKELSIRQQDKIDLFEGSEIYQKHREAITRINLTKTELTSNIKNTASLLSKPINEFTKKVYRTIFEKLGSSSSDNIVFSPFSIHIALSMLYYGSPVNSTTNVELSKALGLNPDQDKKGSYVFNYLSLLQYYGKEKANDANIELANKMFLQDGFTIKQNFVTLVEAFYFTTVDSIDFSNREDAAEQINKFVDNKTRGLIKHIVHPQNFDSFTRLVLINAIYFKANWLHQFKKDSSQLISFTSPNGRVVQQEGMVAKAKFRTSHNNDINARILELPYEDPNFSLYILIPKENHLEALNHIAMTYDIALIRKHLDESFKDQQVRVIMPSFIITYKLELKTILKSMGMHNLFDNAELSDISNSTLFVSNVLHQSQVRVSEKGSEAAASTAIVVDTRTIGQELGITQEFKVDQPFIFLINDNKHQIPLFLGKVKYAPGVIVDDPDCQNGEQFPRNRGTENVLFPCKGRDTIMLEKIYALQKEENRTKWEYFQQTKTK